MQASQKGCSCGCGCLPILIVLIITLTVSAVGAFVFFRDMSLEKIAELSSEYDKYIEKNTTVNNTELLVSEKEKNDSLVGNENVKECSKTLKRFMVALQTDNEELFEESISLSLKSEYKSRYSSIKKAMNDKKNIYKQFCNEDVSLIVTDGKTTPWSANEISILEYLYENEFGNNIELDGVNFTCNIVIFNGSEYISEKATVSLVSENGAWKINSL